MKVSVQTDAQAWKVQADAGQAATFDYGPCCIITLCCLLRPCHQAVQQLQTRLVAPVAVSSW